jgi:alkyl hydroperoxide reductase subunit AhpC
MHCRKHVVRVHQRKDEFEALNTRVLIIGFEKKRRAKGWLKRTKVMFPFLLDHEREVYDAYQIERSILRSWSLKNLWSYLEALFKGQTPDLIKADPNQLGADFIVDKTGILHFTYYSPGPTYRPPLEELLADLQSLR